MYSYSRRPSHRRRALFAILALLGAGGLEVRSAGAASVDPATTLLSDSTLVTGPQLQANSFTFSTPSAGTLDVTLQDVGWPAVLASLTASIYTSTGALGTLDTSGQLIFAVSGPMRLSAFVNSQAQGLLDMGLFSLDVTFAPAEVPVPLPGAGVLFLGGIGLFVGFGFRRHRRGSPDARNEIVMCTD
jgi:hypothetical protein